ncbi:MAG: thiamine phosphate synthase [Thermoanaerobaculia bacterium]|nr:thiamine phosphate synthase [Thermoanaerobaculia bacterium]
MRSYAIADFSHAEDRGRFFGRIEELSRAGIDMIQLRAKQVDDRDCLELAEACRRRIGDRTRFMVNGRVDIARAAGADGVHLPANGIPADLARELAPGFIIGRSCHSVSEVAEASGEGVDLVVLGPVHDARSSQKKASITIDDLSAAARMKVDVYAIGGFDSENIEDLRGTGVRGVAGISMFMDDEPVSEIVNRVRGVSS